MKNLLLTSCLVVATALSPVAASAAMPESVDKAAPAMNMDKASFLKLVESSNAFEIQSSQMAEKKARDGDVKEFAKHMIADHTKAGEELKTAAKLPADAQPMLSPKHAAMLKTLESANEQEFQPLYIEMQAAAHREAVTVFATYAKGGDDEAVKAFAAKTLPTLQMHKMHVMKLVEAH